MSESAFFCDVEEDSKSFFCLFRAEDSSMESNRESVVDWDVLGAGATEDEDEVEEAARTLYRTNWRLLLV